MTAVQGSRRGKWAILGLAAGLMGCLGCESAHYVVRGPDSGVVAIPSDTPELRAKAEKLMHEQFPAGYVLDDVRVVAIGHPYETVTQIGPFAEVQHHQRHEVMLYYHSGQGGPAVPVVAPVIAAAPTRMAPPIVVASPPPAPPVAQTVQPVSLTVQQPLPDGLPPQPVPVK
jgi:hypothetical protein